MSLRSMIVLLILLFSVVFLPAQDSDWKHYSADYPLRSVVKTDEALWIGTNSGLIRIDSQSGEQIRYDNTNSGLVSIAIHSLAIDHQGTLWIGTNGGLSSFDGSTWTNYTNANSIIPSGPVTDITIDQENWVWALVNNRGVVRYDGISWFYYSSYTHTIPNGNLVSYAYGNNGILYISYYNPNNGNSGLAMTDYERWVVLTMQSLGIDGVGLNNLTHDGNYLWMTSTSTEIHRFDQNEIVTYHAADFPDPNLTSFRIFPGHDSKPVFIATSTIDDRIRILKWDNEEWQVIDPNTEDNYLERVTYCFEDGNGNLWLGNETQIKTLEESVLQEVNFEVSTLSSNYLEFLHCDGSDNIWSFSFDSETYQWTLHKLENEMWQNFTAPQASPTYFGLNSLESDSQGRIWFSAGYLPWRMGFFDEIDWTFFDNSIPVITNISKPFVKVLANDDVWCFSTSMNIPFYAIVSRYDGSNWSAVTGFGHLIQSFSVRAAIQDSNSNLWIATQNGILKYDGTLFSLYNTSNSGLPNNDVRCLAVDHEQNLWIGMSNGLAKLTGDQWQVWDSVSSNLPYRTYNDLAIDYLGKVWAATQSHGLVCFDGSEWTVFNTANSPLLSNIVRSIEIDSHQNIWIDCSAPGISRISPYHSSEQSQQTVLPIDNLSLANYPNPFNPQTTIVFSLPERGMANLNIYNLKGQLVKNLARETRDAGSHTIVWNGRDEAGRKVSSGIYYYRLEASGRSQTRKMLLVK